MKISQIEIKGFKRFTNLIIKGLPETIKVIVVVGPNGSGKSSLFDAFLHWYRLKSFGHIGDVEYYQKKGEFDINWANNVNIQFHDFTPSNQDEIKGKFYFRSAYRNDADFTVNNIQKQSDPTKEIRISSLIQSDTVVRENYQRLVSSTLAGVFYEGNNDKTVLELRNELIGKIQHSLQEVFDDLNLSSIGDPLSNGSFYFEKGVSKDFHYKNLSGGEKSAFDLILDLIIKSSFFPDAIFCIDEPETHMHTRLQSKLFNEIYKLIPTTSQLWISTHSIGMLKKARELEKNYPNSIAFLNFDNINFDNQLEIKPTIIDRTIWDKFVELAMDDFAELIAPKEVIFCEGNQLGRKYKNFDAQIYSKIFGGKYLETSFTSIGSSTELENENNTTLRVVSEMLKNSRVIRLVDRDDKSAEEIRELKSRHIRVLGRRHIESYLLDEEIIVKLCNSTGNDDKINSAKEILRNKLEESKARGNPEDDIKSASADIYVSIKKLLGLTNCGNTKDAFFRDTICPLITEETRIFQELEKEIFNL